MTEEGEAARPASDIKEHALEDAFSGRSTRFSQ
jgi:hypothetical protein